MRHERLVHGSVGVSGKDCAKDVAGAEERNAAAAHTDFTAVAIDSSACFASANSMAVFGS
jgi:hypothetical protein